MPQRYFRATVGRAPRTTAQPVRARRAAYLPPRTGKALSGQCLWLGALLAAGVLHLGPVLPVANAQSGPHDTSPSNTSRSLRDVSRRVPAPLPGHPGNVFLLGEQVSLAVPPDLAGAATRWDAVDERGRVVGKGTLPTAAVALGRLGIGWYRIWLIGDDGKKTGSTTAAVIARLARPVPQNSPVCTDSATAWFARRYRGHEAAKQEVFASLAALAGVNWIRDRMSWGTVETAPGSFAADTTYDTSATLQARHGLKVLQVFHSTPKWATDANLDGSRAYKRFPRDLRHAYRFCKAMAQRYQGRVLAWEPWNEANITGFGGHTIDEMCALQKAAYLGLRAGDPDVVACWNVFAGAGTPLHTEGVLANEAWPYFETYNIHTYSRPDTYLGQFETALKAACGRPIWLTECGIRLRTQAELPRGELSPERELEQAAFIARSYASSLFAGVDRHFFFILGNYIEGEVQFGLLRHDQTPRPGYVALAAVGRFLAGATCLGRVRSTASAGQSVYAFLAWPDGVKRDVLVAWSDKPSSWPTAASIKPDAVHDYLGRGLEASAAKALAPQPKFVMLPPGAASKLGLEPPARRAPLRQGAASPVVLQAQFPSRDTALGSQAHEVEPGGDRELKLFVYNLSDGPVSGTVAVASAPDKWDISPKRWPVRLTAMERRSLPARLSLPSSGASLLQGDTVKLAGEFGQAGQPVLAFRLVAELSKLHPAISRPLPAANEASRWEDNIVSRAKMSHAQETSERVVFQMQFADTDPWAYPRLRLRPDEYPDASLHGLALTVQLVEGTGVVRVQFIEANGAAYLAETGLDPDVRTPQRAVVLFAHAKWGSYSKPDPDSRLQPENIRTVLVGINSKRNSTVKMMVGDLAWIAF